MSDRAVSLQPAAAPRVEYRPFDPAVPLPEDVLAAVVFANQPCGVDPRFVRVGLQPLRGARLLEMWHAHGPVRTGRDGAVRFAASASHLFGVVELDEREHGGIAAAAESAYAAIRAFSCGSAHPHLLRVWNHFSGINQGDGDAERYRQFCIGRAAGLGSWLDGSYPAATAIGRHDDDSILQVYWLASRSPGTALENPRQVSPYRYPRSYGPTSPQFSRAMLAGELLMISGTASIVGHASHHPGNLAAQLDESLANLRSLVKQAGAVAPAVSAALGRGSLLKIYLRNAASGAELESALRTRLQPDFTCMILAADICREDLLVEIECVHERFAAP